MMDNLLGNKRIKSRIIFRFIIVGTLASAFLLYRFMYKEYAAGCCNDAWHDFTSDLNKGLDSGGADDIVIGIGQVFMDFWIVAISLFWMIKVKNTRLALAAALFFAMRSTYLQIVAFPFPDHVVWHSPGFLSLTVPYDKTRDFFYSGHTGSLTIIILEFYTVGYKWFTLVPLVCIIYMMNMLLVTRVHYTVDVAAGLVYAFFFYWVAQQIAPYFDWLLSLPYLLGKKAFDKCSRYSRKRRNERESRSSLQGPILVNKTCL